MNAPPYALAEVLAPGIARILAHNPSAFTFTGTQTYLIGEGEEIVVLDPGPELADHLAALIGAIGDRRVAAIACTHTHRDHSPATRALAAATGAPIIGCGPLMLDGTGLEAGFDRDYAPDRVLADGEAIEFGVGERLTAVATPGHTSNHLCFAYDEALFTGDHVMGWSTTVVVPPDGDMGEYMLSLDKLRRREDRIFYPAHGPAIEKPQQYLRGLIGHRMQRERQILRLVSGTALTVPQIVAAAYPGLDSRLVAAAGGSVTAHLLDLARRGLVEAVEEDKWTAAA